MKINYKLGVGIAIVELLVWGLLLCFKVYFHESLVNNLNSILEYRVNHGADFNTDSAIAYYLTTASGTIFSSITILLSGIFGGLFVFLYILVGKLNLLERELKQIKEKFNV